MVRIDCSQLIMALVILSQSFPSIRISSLDSRTWKEVGTLIFPIFTGTLSMIPRERVLAPFAVTTTIFEDLFILYPSFSAKAFVIMLVAAPLSIIAVWAFCPILKVHFAAEVGSSLLSTRLASFVSSEALSLKRLIARAKPERYLG